jgi:hypothetical protein
VLEVEEGRCGGRGGGVGGLFKYMVWEVGKI